MIFMFFVMFLSEKRPHRNYTQNRVKHEPRSLILDPFRAELKLFKTFLSGGRGGRANFNIFRNALPFFIENQRQFSIFI